MNQPELILSEKQIDQIYIYATQIVDNLPPRAINELLEGYNHDQTALLNEIILQVNNVVNFGHTLETEKLSYLDSLEESMDGTLKKLSFNYFVATCLPNFDLGWRHLEMGNLIQLYPWSLFLASRGMGKSYFSCFSFPLWRLYSYDRPAYFTKDTIDNKNRKETLLITNESSLGVSHLSKIIEEINNNDILKEKLNPSGRELGKTGFTTETGSLIKLRSLFSSGIRGCHVGGLIYDDLLDESSLYSKEQRAKAKEIFTGSMVPTVEPGGFLLGSGCVNPNTIIQTKDGLTRIGTLCPDKIEVKAVHDFVKPIMGVNSYSLSSKYWCNGITSTNKITLKRGYNLECSEIHPLLTLKKDCIVGWVKSSDLVVGDFVAIKLGCGLGEGKKVKLEQFKTPSKFSNDRKNIIHHGYLNEELAYFMGLWIADGSFDKTKAGFTITKQNEGIRNFVLSGFNRTCFKVRKHDPIKMDMSSVELLDIYNQVGMKTVTAKYKRIPDKILAADKKTLTTFLSGMFDGDGCFYKSSSGDRQLINYSSISEGLIDDLQTILLHLGIMSSKYNKGIIVTEKVIGKNEVFILEIQGQDVDKFMQEIGFLHSGKGKFFEKVKYLDRDVEGVPFQSELLKNIKKENYEILKSRKFRSPILSNKLNSNRIKHKYLKPMYDWFVECGATGDSLEKLGTICNFDDIIWMPIVSIEKGECYTVDFVIPKEHNFISNGIVSHNTPYVNADGDLYTDLKKDKKHMVWEYPAICPHYVEGRLSYRLLAPDRFTYKHLLEIKQSLGSSVFSREYMVSPVTDDSSIFPYEYLNKCTIGMENVGFATNIQSYPFRLQRVVIGCDFAKSANTGSDYIVYSVWGIDENETYYLLYIWRKKGAGYLEQINQIVALDQRFKPQVIICEANGFQSIMSDLVKQRGLRNVEEFTTTGFNKKNSYEGLPSLAAIMERGQLRVPFKEGETRELVQEWMSEFNSIAFNEDSGKLEGTSSHDDMCMSTFFAVNELRTKTTKFRFHQI